MKKLNVAIIGQGRSGRDIHGQYFLTEHGKEHFNVVAVADWNADRRARAKETFGCDVYEDYTEFYKRDDIDFVVNSTFSYEHYPITLDLLEHKMNVIVEKPFARTAMDCDKMIKAAKDNNVMLTVFQQSRVAPYYQKVKEVIESGVLGEIQQININFNGFARRWDWQCSNRFCGGILLNTGPHPMDQALDLLGTDDMPNVFSVLRLTHSAGDAEDYAKIILTYPGRPVIDVEINTHDCYKEYTYKVLADKGSLVATMEDIKWKYHDEKEMPELVLEPLCKEDGISPAYCSETLEWHEFEEKIVGTAFNSATKTYYQNIYNHLTKGEKLLIDPKKIRQQIAVAELVHAQNPMETVY